MAGRSAHRRAHWQRPWPRCLPLSHLYSRAYCHGRGHAGLQHCAAAAGNLQSEFQSTLQNYGGTATATAGARRCASGYHTSLPSSRDSADGRLLRGSAGLAQLREEQYDVVVAGAGVIGAALAMELSQYQLRVLLVESKHDVGEGTSKANAAIVHTGFDATPGSLESQLVVQASLEWPEMAARLQIPFRECGALLVAKGPDQAALLPEIHAKAVSNGTEDCVRVLSAAEVFALEPEVSPDVCGGLLIGREAVADPFTTVVAYAEVALANGVDIALGVTLAAVEIADAPSTSTRLTLRTSGAESAGLAVVHSMHVVNATGLGSRAVADLYGGEHFDINPRRGQFLVYDRHASSLVSRIILPLPTKQTKGMLVAPTIFGNLISGPTAEDLPMSMRDDPSTTLEGLEHCRLSAHSMVPQLKNQPPIASYAGMRCHCDQGSYTIKYNDGQRLAAAPGNDGTSTNTNITTVTGIRSTGFTSSAVLARHIVEGMVREQGLVLVQDETSVDSRPPNRMPGWWGIQRSEAERFPNTVRPASITSDFRPHDDVDLTASRADYGRIICSCEHISEGEILDAIRSPLRLQTLDALKRRTRAMTGRCQSFNCMVPIAKLLSRELSIPLHAVTKCGPGTEIAAGPVSEASETHRMNEFSEPAQLVDMDAAAVREHYRVVVVGAGPAGVGVVHGLIRRGVSPMDILVVDRASEVGGIPRRYGHSSMASFVEWTRLRVVTGGAFADRLEAELRATGVQIALGTHVKQLLPSSHCADQPGTRFGRLVMVSPTLGRVQVHADAVVMACGARETGGTERWQGIAAGDGLSDLTLPGSVGIAGARTARMLHTTHILDLLAERGDAGALPSKHPLVLGSDLVAYGSAAKLSIAISGEGTSASAAAGIMSDTTQLVSSWRGWLEACLASSYFRRYAPPPTWQTGGHDGATILAAPDGTRSVSGVRLRCANGHEQLQDEVDAVVLAGRLIPNSELLVEAGLSVSLPSRRPIAAPGEGWFVAGNIVGWVLPAQWCRYHGEWVGRGVAKSLGP